jgi:tight adherence protein C
MNIFIATLVGFVLFIGGAGMLILSIRWFSADEMTARLNNFVAEESPKDRQWRTLVNIRTRELSGSLVTRIFLPIVRQIGALLDRMTPTRTVDDVRHKLSIAGNPYGFEAREYFGMRILFTVFGFALGYLFILRGSSTLNLVAGGGSLIIGLLLPPLWLNSRVRARQNEIRKSLPDALDMLSVCADAGLGFDQSLQRVGEYWDTPISRELSRVVSEIEMGFSRQEALRNLAQRLDVTELSSFVAVILQSDHLGMSIKDTLHAQAEQMRIERRYRAQEKARTVPIKMLLPLTFLIFPAIMAMVVGPALPSLIDLFANF